MAPQNLKNLRGLRGIFPNKMVHITSLGKIWGLPEDY